MQGPILLSTIIYIWLIEQNLFFVIAQWSGMQHAYLLHHRGGRGGGHRRKRWEPWTRRRVTAGIWVNQHGLAEGLGPAASSVDRSVFGTAVPADAGIIIALTMIMRVWGVNRRCIQTKRTASPLVWHGRVWKTSGRASSKLLHTHLLPVGEHERLVYTKATLFDSMVGCKTLMRTDMNLSSWFSWGQGWVGVCAVLGCYPDGCWTNGKGAYDVFKD